MVQKSHDKTRFKENISVAWTLEVRFTESIMKDKWEEDFLRLAYTGRLKLILNRYY